LQSQLPHRVGSAFLPFKKFNAVVAKDLLSRVPAALIGPPVYWSMIWQVYDHG
jgi:hypothetical protein